MRVSTAFSRLLDLPGVWVRAVEFRPDKVVVTVALRRQRLVCPVCGYHAAARYDTRPVASAWRHLDLGRWALQVRAHLRRVDCPDHGVLVEAVPFARAGSRFTRDFEDLVAWTATTMNKTHLCRLVRIDWATVGRIIARVMGDALDPDRLDGLFRVGVDEVSWRKGHKYLTLVSNHDTAKIVWGGEGRDSATLDGFFAELGPQRSGRIEAVSMDMSPAFRASVTAPGHASVAVICYDPFHVVALATKAMDQVRVDAYRQMRHADPSAAKVFKGARWILMRRPETLTADQREHLGELRRAGGRAWRAYELKEALREIFTNGLDPTHVEELLERFCSRASRSGLAPFARLARTIRTHKRGILTAVRLKINNAAHEALNRKVRLIISRAYGFHSAQAALALVMLTLGPVQHRLPHERPQFAA